MLQAVVQRTLGVEMTLLDVDAERVLDAGEGQLPWAIEGLYELGRQVLRNGRPQILHEVGPLEVLAIPSFVANESLVALGGFLTRPLVDSGEIERVARAVHVPPDALRDWAPRQTCIAASVLERIAAAICTQQMQIARIVNLETEVEKLTSHLCGTYEEINLIYRLTHHLNISRSEEELGRLALEWMLDILPAEAVAIHLDCTVAENNAPLLMTAGRIDLDNQQFAELIGQLRSRLGSRPIVANAPITRRADWRFPQVRQMVLVPLREADRPFGWIAAFNHNNDGEFGTVEADLLTSVSAILGIHCGNSKLYGAQSELLSNFVRAMTSAIDAKDPYTRGHSDRVARVAVSLATEMGCEQHLIETLYLSGLLHDIGKIGIDDSVLRKPGKLTPEEFEHIKTHARIGYNILCDIHQMSEVLPVVLHHHEAWDGTGYPVGLAGEDIPLLARITAVADAFDAMGSDRVYRKGLSDEALDSVIRGGAGKQWDPHVVDAFFRCRHKIRDIAKGRSSETPPELKHCFHSKKIGDECTLPTR